ncbi:hypothetical protein E4T56_gene3354 [Termitomyces sp. T112]|nr:hypothetical protein E4T56_gene3354 [Termitomyces sp. T112]
MLECDASNYAIAGILSQIDSGGKDLCPIAFYTHSMILAELNYDIYDKELLAIVKAFHQWRAYLEGSPHHIQVYSNYNNLQCFTTTKQLSCHQAHWPKTLLEYNFTIHYCPRQLGAKPDALTQRPNVYSKKLFEAEWNVFNHQVKESSTKSEADSHNNSTDKSTVNNPFTLSPDHCLLLQSGQIYAPDYFASKYSGSITITNSKDTQEFVRLSNSFPGLTFGQE